MVDESIVSEAARKAAQSGTPVLTGFLDPDEQEVAAKTLAPIGEVVGRFYGGYRGASRRRLAIMPSYYLDDFFDPDISFFQISTVDVPCEPAMNSEAAVADLRAHGVLREDIGDVFATPDGWEGVVSAHVFREELRGQEMIQLDAAEVLFPGQVGKEIRATVASLRLDALAGAGFAASRTRLAQEIKAGRFKVNGMLTESPSAKVSGGDVIICRGRGRLIVKEVKGETKRGRIAVTLLRYSVYTPNSREEGRHAHTT